MTNYKKVNLLWTGGWDSTFRLLQLIEENVQIQLFYFIDEKRKSTNIEIERMKKILKYIKGKKDFRAIVKDINYINVKDIKKI